MKNDFHAENFLETSCVRVTVAGKDGIVRTARVKVARADRTPRILTRSVKHLFPLEVNEKSEVAQNEVQE